MSTSILDSRDKIAKLDKENMIASIEELGNQIQHAWEDLQKVMKRLAQPQ